jgi:hypothetical protein
MRSSLSLQITLALILAAVLGSSVAAATRTTAEPPRSSGNGLARDSVDIMTTVQGESAGFWNKDFDAWASYWVHSDYVRVVGWWEAGGVRVVEGWDAVSAGIEQSMRQSPEPNPNATEVRRENINIQVRGNVAWVTFDQYGLDTGDALMDMPGLSRETRVLEKQDGKWRIAYVGWLLEG